MTEQLIAEIQRKMLPYLNNEQLMHLRDAMAETLEGATITYDSGSIPAEETDAVEAFITAKRIEGCSEKTLSYYRKTIESLIAGVGKAVQQVTTDDLRRIRHEQSSLCLQSDSGPPCPVYSLLPTVTTAIEPFHQLG